MWGFPLRSQRGIGICLDEIMKANDAEATYTIASKAGQLIGDIVGSPAVGARIVSSLFVPGEKPSEKNIQRRFREALMAGNLSVLGLGPSGLKRLQSALNR
jgi:DNA repair protein RadC